MQHSTGPGFRPRRISGRIDSRSRSVVSGRRSPTYSRKRGRYVQARATPGDYGDIALDATLREAALHQATRHHSGPAIAVAAGDIHSKVRVRKAANLIVFAVDASWSMAAAERMQATKGAILSLLVDAYQKRDQVALVTFQRADANVVLPPTSDVAQARAALGNLPVGGKTPLSAGLLTAYDVFRRERNQNRDVLPLLVLMTDGAGNISLSGMSPREESLMLAGLIARQGIRAVVINTEHPALDRGLAKEIAQALQAPCYSLDELKADRLYLTIKKELQ